ncbi:TIGR02530 family flagellar biosynthesis protein [Sporolactobacillus laevolacticus]|uniref:Flagellar protein n=1 Tax=Sporolactobacillus laevolacticus DSM 442 TaxID=1395513 RepID=V6J8F0_9BACL|nr:TIGR02530 family flagellar biosynthesis protein [Sporolactobacillus laevolacticus]EST13069.1 flagellar protein [Sporolactobacillus laevolacticus DSM 442]
MTKINAFTYQPLTIPSHTESVSKQNQKPNAQKSSFSESLEEEYEKLPLKLSKHARERIDERDIHISQTEWNLIHSKMQEAKKMGINDSLVLTKDAALVVNMPNQTVITAMGLEEANTRIFSNINGTIVINH